MPRLLLALLIALSPVAHAHADADEPPRLLVLIIADQFGSLLVDRYGDLFSGGLATLAEDGTWWRRSDRGYALTNSTPGHATAATGTWPSRHGLVDNDWWQEGEDGEWAQVSSVIDEEQRFIGLPPERAPGWATSPKYFDATGLADWVLAADPESRALVIAQGAASSTALGGRDPAPGRKHVLMFATRLPGLVMSDFYGDVLPGWVDRFNRIHVPRYARQDAWTLAAPGPWVARARADDTAWEHGGEDVAFPHAAPELDGSDEALFARGAFVAGSPAIDALVLEAARVAIANERLGQDEHLDYLGLNLSGLDEGGHGWGPYSLEQADTLYRLDHALAEFIRFLDAQVGREHYRLALTGDHGVAPAPEGLDRPELRVSPDAISELLLGLPEDDPVPALSAWPHTARVFTAAELEAASLDWNAEDPWLTMYRRSWRPDRRSEFPLRTPEGFAPALPVRGFQVVLNEHVNVDWATSIHGSIHPYDREVPLYLLGKGVPEGGEQAARVWSVDVAPTLAAGAGLQPPRLDGRDLLSGEPHASR